MKKMTEGLLILMEKIHNIILDVKQLGRAEVKNLFEFRVKTNISRINLMIIVTLIIECTNLYVFFTAKLKGEFKNIYFILYLSMIFACMLQIIYFHILKWKYPESIRKHKWYIYIWTMHFVCLTWCFHGLELLENDHYENLFLLLVVLNIILILSNKEIIICSAAILAAEYSFLFITNGKVSNYQWSTILTICSGIIGRVFFVYYTNTNLLQWKLKRTNEELEEQINRYHILQTLTEEDIFEYDHKKDKMIISFASEKPAHIYYNYLEKVKKHYICFFDKTDEYIMLEAYKQLKAGKKKGTLLFHVDTPAGKKAYQTIFTTIYDENKNPILTIGKLYQIKTEELEENETGVDKFSSFS